MRRFAFPLILLLAFLLRFIGLTNFPVGFNADEASFGYDAYSIMKTGKDQWGSLFPLVLKSFGDYKSPLYSYLTVPSVAVFGLNKFAVRLPNVIIGTLAVFAVYLLVKKLSGSWKLAGLAGFLLAVNPWAVMLSRGAFEANLITFFLPFAIYLFLSKKYLWSAVFFGLNLFTYHSAKLITPVIALVLTGKRKLFVPMAVFLVFLAGILYTFSIGGGARISERSIFQGALEQGAEAKIRLMEKGTNPLVARLLHNKYQVVAQRFISNYFQYFSPKFLFTQGAGESYYGMRPGTGVIYIFEGILLLGLIRAISETRLRKILLPMLLWLIVAPLPAALATGVGYSGNRASGILPVLQILEAFGAYGWWLILRKMDKKIIYVAFAAFGALAIFNIYHFINLYFSYPSNLESRQMVYGSLEAAEWLSENSNGKIIIVSRSLSEPQIFIAFAGPRAPGNYQKESKNWKVETWVDQIPEYKLGNYTFKSLEWSKDSAMKNALIVGRPEEFSETIHPLKTFYYPDGHPAILIVDADQTLYASTY